MPAHVDHDVTELLAAVEAGESAALDRLVTRVYQELRRLARHQLRRRNFVSLDSAALVNEAYLKLLGQAGVRWNGRNHFFAAAATAMRHLVVDHCRRRAALKRGGGVQPVTFDEERVGARDSATTVIALNEALDKLAAVSPRLVRVVELRHFAGLSVEEIAELLDVSPPTIKRDWRKARAFLSVLLDESPTRA